jgi:hypothetical protein
MSDERKYHLAGTAYCDCQRGVDHEGDAEADAAWDEGGWVELERLYTRRHREEVYRLRAELEAVQDHAERLSCLLRGMARKSLFWQREYGDAAERAHAYAAEARRYRAALAEMVDVHKRLEDGLVSNEEYDSVLERTQAALAEEAQR